MFAVPMALLSQAYHVSNAVFLTRIFGSEYDTHFPLLDETGRQLERSR